MPLPSAQQKKKRTNSTALIVIFLILCGYAGYYAYQVYWPRPQVSISITIEKKNLPIKKVDWEKTVYEDPFFLSLKNRLPLQVTVDKMGNKEPFAVKKK